MGRQGRALKTELKPGPAPDGPATDGPATDDARDATGAVGRTFVLSQRIRYEYSGPVTGLRQYLRVVPPPTHGAQRRRSWELSVEGVEVWKARTWRDPFGNVTTSVTVPEVHEAVEFAVEVAVEGAPEDPDAPHVCVDGGRYLEATALTAPDDAIADLALRGPADPAALCARVHDAFSYEWGITAVHTTASEALAGGRGVCQDYAHVMLAACHVVGIPARYVSGHLVGEGGSHAWVEVLRPDPGRDGRWLVEGWDPTHDSRTGVDHLVVAVGRDYSDAGPMWGTFEGDGVSSSLSVDKRLSV